MFSFQREITLSIFAHIIHPDNMNHHMALDGNIFFNMLTLLNEYNLKLDVDKRMHNTLSKMQGDIEAFIHTPENNRMEHLFKHITALKAEDVYYMEGGWISGYGNGHSILYAFSKRTEHYYLSVYNAGSGIAYHEKDTSNDAHQYQPLHIIKFSLKTDGYQEIFRHVLSQLLMLNASST